VDGALVTAGIACIIGAIVGGGLKAFGIEIPIVQSRVRQLALAVVGMALLVGSRLPPSGETPTGSAPTPDISQSSGATRSGSALQVTAVTVVAAGPTASARQTTPGPSSGSGLPKPPSGTPVVPDGPAVLVPWTSLARWRG
jgi:hypothetical protein